MSTVLVDLTKISQEALAVLQAAGVIPPASASASGPASAASPSGATPGQPALPADTGSPVAPAQVAPPSLSQRILAAVNQIAGLLTTGVAGPEAAAGATAFDAVEGLGKVIWSVFHPHTNHTSQHSTLAEAVAAGAQHMATQQPGVVEKADENVAFTITPQIRVSGADVAKLPPGVATKSAN